MKSEYIFIAIGVLLTVWSQAFLRDDMWILRIILTIIGIAIAGSAFEISKRIEKRGK